jgi:hypothetical protein
MMQTERSLLLRKAMRKVSDVDDRVYACWSRLGAVYDATEFDRQKLDVDEIVRQQDALYEMIDALEEAVELLDYALHARRANDNTCAR